MRIYSCRPVTSAAGQSPCGSVPVPILDPSMMIPPPTSVRAASPRPPAGGSVALTARADLAENASTFSVYCPFVLRAYECGMAHCGDSIAGLTGYVRHGGKVCKMY